jgi:Kelch motif
MVDLKTRLSEAESLRAPDLWDEAQRRAVVPSSTAGERVGTRTLRSPRERWRRPATIAVAFAVFLAAWFAVWAGFRSTDYGIPAATPSSGPSSSPTFEPGWTQLPAPPEIRSGAASAWTGSQLLVWGGYVDHGTGATDPNNDGFAFDPVTETWSDVPSAPIEARSFPAAAWTGNELVIWGGARSTEYGAASALDDGAAYDPATGSWRLLPPAPIGARAPLDVWTGRELIVWGTSVRSLGRPIDGAAYDPTTNAWRRIADAPIELTDASAVWTGKEMVVFGAALHGGNVPETPVAIGAAYDPVTDSWRRIADSDLSPQASAAAWDGHEIVAWDYLNHSAAYSPTTDQWRRLPNVDIWTGECAPRSVGMRGFVYGDYCGIEVVWDAGSGVWTDVSRMKAGPSTRVVPVAAGDGVFVMINDLNDGTESAWMYIPS